MIRTINLETSEIGECTVNLIGHYGTDHSICEAARVSYKSNKERKIKRDDEELIQFLMSKGHLSPFETADLHFYIKCPIYVARQILRYRTAKVNERSLRYSTPSEFELLEDSHVASTAYLTRLHSCYNTYKYMRNLGVMKEEARKILPVSTITEISFKIDVRNSFNIFSQRLTPETQKETKYIVSLMYELAKSQFPITFKYYEDEKH